ncbi:MAG TPA: hypothetical protein VJ673_18905 [Aromatoleum sp.]|uniref:hypothetical protein n=1 Tax=Aromatoleum sp. TaxID=2307007 RepID=UPI002B48A364|nr:hypothetical protein [Aromatoleum sp.]HJV27758.1 hypothetical protein [Aromatoleum sp.]
MILIAAVMAGIARLGVPTPLQASILAAVHGPLMVCAFFGTVISLERAVALGGAWVYLAPAACALGGVALVVGLPPEAAALLFVCGSAVLVAASIEVIRRHLAAHTVTLLLAALCWLVGNLVWAFRAEGALPVAAWLGFLVITIAGERLELTRLLPRKRAALPMFLLAVGVVSAGCLMSFHMPDVGNRVFGLGLLLLALWLARYDIARHNVRQSGLTRFIAVCLLSGYGWLAFGGVLAALGGLEVGVPWRDAALHAVGLGFVVAMVFGHAPIILPAVARVRIAYHPAMYFPLVLLHLSLALRVASFAPALHGLHAASGVANAIALAVFGIVIGSRVSRAGGHPRQSPIRRQNAGPGRSE